ncbi:MAG: ribonuclease HII [Treponema sp.]|nr:ribonuclease HII [Treponema sp.]
MSGLLAGLDEAGRGPLAGPVVAACVVLSPGFPVEILGDSKKLSERKRNMAEKIIKEKCLWGVARVEHDEIDRINILNASLLAMKKAYEKMVKKLEVWCKSNGIDFNSIGKIHAIVDGNKVPDLSCEVESKVKADTTVPEVMAASILAKVERDRIMVKYDALYPEYGYAKHKGYPTKAHREICRKIGPSPIQRMSFNYEKE